MSCQDVCVSMGYDEPNEFYVEDTRHAAKQHTCCECGDAIVVGESHQYIKGKSDGVFWAYRTCAACAEIRKVFVCDGAVFEELWEAIREQMFPEWNEMTAIDCLARLTTDAAIAKVRAMHADYMEQRS